MSDREVLITTETELLVDDTSELLTETVTQREALFETVTELLTEDFLEAQVLVEVQPPELLVDETATTELLEVAMQGPPGPKGDTGDTGPGGDAGSIGGLAVDIVDPQVGDVLALNVSLQWQNDRVLDGGNF